MRRIIRAALLVATFTYTSVSAAGMCGDLFSRLRGIPRAPVVVRGLDVPVLANVAWLKSPIGDQADFQSAWGRGTVLINELNVTLWLRPLAGDLYVSREVLATLNRELGRVYFREEREVSWEYEGETGVKTGLLILHLKRGWAPTEAHEERVRHLLRLFLRDLPEQIRRR